MFIENLIVRPEEEKDFSTIEQLVLNSFATGTTYSDGKCENQLIKEIRSQEYYIPELSFVAVLNEEFVGHFMLSHFPISEKHSDKFLLLAPVAVNCKYFNKGIGKKMIPIGLQKAKNMGYKGVLVEGNPNFYHNFGFITSTNYKIDALPQFTPPSPECLMATEFYPGAMKDITGMVNFSMYKSLTTI